MAEQRKVDITTTKQPKTVTRTERLVDGFTNPDDGSRNEAAYREFEEGKQQLASTYHVNPETGRVEKKYLSDFLNFDPVEERKRREEEAALNRRKQKESAWINAISVLGDMFTTAAGGNVWKRDADKHAKEAHDANIRLQQEQRAEDAAIDQETRKTEQAYAKAVDELAKRVGNAHRSRVYKVETTGEETHQTGWREGASPRPAAAKGATSSSSSSAAGGGSSRNQPKIVNVQLSNGNTAQLHMSPNAYAASGKYLSSLYNALISSGNENIANVLEESGINPQKDGTYKAEDLLSSGIVFDNPQVRNEFVKIIKSDPNMTDEEKEEIERELRTYPAVITEPQKKSILQRIIGIFSKEPAKDTNVPPYKRNQQANDNNVPPYKRKKQ